MLYKHRLLLYSDSVVFFSSATFKPNCHTSVTPYVSFFQVAEPQFYLTSWEISGVLPTVYPALLNLSVIHENSIRSLLIYDIFFISLSTNQFCLHAFSPIPPSLSIKLQKNTTDFYCCNYTLITDMDALSPLSFTSCQFASLVLFNRADK